MIKKKKCFIDTIFGMVEKNENRHTKFFTMEFWFTRHHD